MRAIRQLENQIISLRGKVLDLRKECTAKDKKIRDMQERLNRLRLLVPYVARQERDFDELRMRYRGHKVMPSGKVKLRQRETA